MPGVVASAGDYTVELDTGFLLAAFTLDTSQLNGADTLDGTTSFADITSFVLGVNYKRGRSTPFDQFGAGTMSFTLNDELAGGLLNPFDTTSPFYDPIENRPGLAPMRKVRLFRGTTPLFTGIVETYNYQYDLNRQNIITVNCIDDFWLLANTFMDAFNPSAETSGQRISTVLALPEVDYTAATDIAAGTVDLGHSSAYDVAADTNVLEYLQQINSTAEFGRLFIAANGTLTFDNRIGNTFSSPVAVFSDQGTDFKYRNVQIEFDARQVINRSVVTGLNGHTETKQDLTSQATYFVQTRDIGQSLLHVTGQIEAAADYLLEPQPVPRLTALMVNLAMLTDVQRDTVATIDIGDTIQIIVDVPNIGVIGEELSVEGIDGEIRLDGGHTLTFYTANTAIVYLLQLAGFTVTQTRTNLVQNPSFEVNNSLWTAGAGVTLARSTAQAYVGAASGLVTLTNTPTNSGINNLSNRSAATAGLSYTASTYAQLNTGSAFTYLLVIFFYDASNNILSVAASPATTLGLTWERKTVTGTAPANTVTVGMQIRRNSALVGTASFYVDAIMIEQTSVALPYFDGNTVETYTGFTLVDGPYWTGTRDLSISVATWGQNGTFVDTNSQLDDDNALG